MRHLKPLAIIAAIVLAVSGSYAQAKPGGAAVDSTGGMASSHMGRQELSNTNGPKATDRDKGLDRAADRGNKAAAKHSKTAHPKKHSKIAHHKRAGTY